MNFLHKKIGSHSLWQYVPHIIRHDFPRKLTQLVLTLLIFTGYHYHQTQQDQNISEATFDNVRVNLEMENGLCLLSEKKPVCKITAKGKTSVLAGLSGRNFEVRKKVTLSDYEDWKRGGSPVMKLAVRKSEILFMDELRGAEADKTDFTDLSAEDVELQADIECSRTLYEIRPVFERSGDLPGNYRVEVSPVLPPGETFSGITVSGPQSRLEKYSRVQTECFKISNSVSYDTTVKLEKLSGGLKYAGDSAVRLHVEITPPAPRAFEDVPLQVLMSPDLLKKGHSITMEPQFVKVRISGQEKVSSVRKEQLHPYVNVQEFTPEKKYKIQCWCEENDIQILDVVPDSTIVRLIPDSETESESPGAEKEET